MKPRPRSPHTTGLLLAGLLAGVLSACTVDTNLDDGDSMTEPPGTALSTEDGVDTWDLRQPPTRADVGLPDGEHTAVYETRERRPLVLLLPEEVRLEIEARLVVFNDLLRIREDDPDPTTMNISTGALDTDVAYDRYTSSLETLGLPAGAADRWRADIEKAPDSGPEAGRSVSSGDRSVDLGSVTVGLGVTYSPVSQLSILKLSLSWVPLGTASSPPR